MAFLPEPSKFLPGEMMTVWAPPAVPDGWPSFAGKIYWEEAIFSGYWIGMCSAWWRVGVCFPTRAAPSLLVPCSWADPGSSRGTIQFISSGPCQRICCYLQRSCCEVLAGVFASHTRWLSPPLAVAAPALFAFWWVLPSQQWHMCVGQKGASCSAWDQESSREGVLRSW